MQIKRNLYYLLCFDVNVRISENYFVFRDESLLCITDCERMWLFIIVCIEKKIFLLNIQRKFISIILLRLIHV